MNKSWYVAEPSSVAYGGEEADFPYERELVKAQFVRELTEYLGYPQSAIHLNVVAPKESGFQVVDLIVENGRGEIEMIAGVETPENYKKNQEKLVWRLYEYASMFSKSKRIKYLVYYTRWYEKTGLLCKQYTVIDYAKYPTYFLWQRSNFLSEHILPRYISNKA